MNTTRWMVGTDALDTCCFVSTGEGHEVTCFALSEMSAAADLVDVHNHQIEALTETNARLHWQPIATAPKDGTRVLVYVTEYGTKYWACVKWQEFGDGSKGWIGPTFTSEPEGYSTTFFLPSHWLPLPAPPEETP